MLQVEQIHVHACALDAWAESKEPIPDLMRRQFDDWLTAEPPRSAPTSERGSAMRAVLTDLGIAG